MADTLRLDSISWQKPGRVEIVLIETMHVTQYPPSRIPGAKDLSKFVDFPGVYAGMSVRKSGIIAEIQWKFMCGVVIPRVEGDRSPDGLHSENWSMNVVLDQLDFIKHPDAKSIAESNGGIFRGGRVVWAGKIPDPKDKNKLIDNPFYGIRSYFAPTVDLTVERLDALGSALSFPQIDSVGYSRKNAVEQRPLNSGFGFVDVNESGMRKRHRRPWLLVEHSLKRAGVQRVESLTWRYSADGWVDQIYDDDYQF